VQSAALEWRRDRVDDHDRRLRVETALLPHLDAAYNLARWLVRNETDAHDVVQESYLRAFRYADGLRGADGRAWLLTIVRNTAYTWLRRRRTEELPATDTLADDADPTALDPAVALVRHADRTMVREAIEALPIEFREAIVLREIEGLTYKEIAAVIDVPLGTVMSRLARARARLHRELSRRVPGA
jgi:RNA polymerase sigma-70 factor (ECF subfamily)